MNVSRSCRGALCIAGVASLLLLGACAGTPTAPTARPAGAAKPARAAADSVTRQKLRAELAAVPGAAGFEMRLDASGLVLVLPARELFRADTALLREAAAATLRGWGAVLARHPRAHIVLTGHTDLIGRSAYNQEFSRQRAAAVATALAATGVAADRIEVRGAGEAEPRSSQPGIAGREMNRRVEMRIRL